MWDIQEHEKYTSYKNTIIELNVDIYKAENGKEEVWMNYMGYNIAMPMMFWEFNAELEFADIKGVRLDGDDDYKKCFIIDEGVEDEFLEEMYFFLVDNDMRSVFRDIYKV